MGLKLRFALCLLCLGALVFSVDARGRRGRSRYRRGSRSRRFGGSDMPDTAPPVFEYKYSARLDADEYVEQVEKAVNGSQNQQYFPFVLFHESRCHQCKWALPEFEKGAGMFEEAEKEGKLHGLGSPVRFFVIECDSSPQNRQKCSKHVGTVFPVLKLFRDARALQFHGQWRDAKSMADWAMQVSRPIMLDVNYQAETHQYIERGTLFIIKAEEASDPALLKAWVELSQENIEGYYFAVTPLNSDMANSMPPAPSVTVLGKNMDPSPLPSKLTVSSLREWVFMNMWPVVIDMTPELVGRLMKSRRDVVVFAHKYRNQVRLTEHDEFWTKALELRKDSDMIFAGLACSVKENSELLAKFFPFVSPPAIFAFSGNESLNSGTVYWEDPWLTSGNLSVKKINELLSSDWNKQDGSMVHWVKGWTKRSVRFGTGSTLGAIVMIVMPIFLGWFCCLCVWEFKMSDDDNEQKQTNQSKTVKNPCVRGDSKKLQAPNASLPQSGIQDARSRMEREMKAAVAERDYVRAGALQIEIQKLSGQKVYPENETAQDNVMIEARPLPDDNLRQRR